jgi:hypothetical protein
VHRDDLIPHLLVHAHERLVAQDTGIGHEDMHRSESVEASFDDLLTLFGGADGGHGFPAG